MEELKLELAKFTTTLIVEALCDSYSVRKSESISNLMEFYCDKIKYFNHIDGQIVKMTEKKLREIVNLKERMKPMIEFLANDLVNNYSEKDKTYLCRLYKVIHLDKDVTNLKELTIDEVKTNYNNHFETKYSNLFKSGQINDLSELDDDLFKLAECYMLSEIFTSNIVDVYLTDDISAIVSRMMNSVFNMNSEDLFSKIYKEKRELLNKINERKTIKNVTF